MRFDRYLKGLHAKFIALVCATLLLMLAVVVLMLQRQGAMQHEVVHQSRDSMHALVFERLRVHGEALSAQVADTLVNPLYYFDLDTIGVVARSVLRQPDVRYVLVYDNKGDIIHDGSGDIPTYGKAMRRIVLPQAARVIVPPLGNEFNNMLKTTSLLTILSVQELFVTFQILNANGPLSFHPFELFLACAIWFLMLTTIWSIIQAQIEKRLARGVPGAPPPGGPGLASRLLGLRRPSADIAPVTGAR